MSGNSAVEISAPSTTEESPIWSQCAAGTLLFALVYGFGALSAFGALGSLVSFLTPSAYIALQLALALTAIALAPRGAVSKLVLPLPTVLFVGWMLASYLWTNNTRLGIGATLTDLTTIMTVVVMSQLLGRHRFVRTLLHSGYVAIALIILALLVQPSVAYQTGGIAPGLKGSFIHKNAMAPCLLVITALVLCAEDRRLFRRGFVGFVAVLILLGQSTTGLLTLIVLLIVNYSLSMYNDVAAALGRARGTIVIGAIALSALTVAQASAAIIRLSGKDLTLSSRSTIWESLVVAIGERPWQGYGYGVWQSIWLEPVASINLSNGFLVTEAHNAALDLLLRLGMIGLGLYVVQLVSTATAGARGVARGDSFGRFTLLFCLIVVTVGYSESLTAFSVWAGLLAALAVVAAPRRDLIDHPSGVLLRT